jgi:hypothetical protein
MNLTEHPFLITVGALIGMILQMVMNRTSGKRQRVLRIMLLIFWAIFGLVVIIGNAVQWQQMGVLIAAAGAGLGVGFMLTGTGQALQKKNVATVGTLILVVSITTYGISAAVQGQLIAAGISLSLGLAMLITSLPGIPGSAGQILVGLVLVASGSVIAVLNLTSAYLFENLIVAIGLIVLGTLTLFLGLKALARKLQSTEKLESKQTA